MAKPASSQTDDAVGGGSDHRHDDASEVENLDVLVLGGGPAGVVAAVRAARLGARTALITRDALGGIAANDGPSRSARSPTRRA
jgi:alkyl hydroperoxide reductase subunit AhpF